MELSITNPQTKECQIQICFVRRWYFEFCVNFHSLSTINIRTDLKTMISLNNLSNQTISLAVPPAATIFASVVEIASEVWLWLNQDIAPSVCAKLQWLAVTAMISVTEDLQLIICFWFVNYYSLGSAFKITKIFFSWEVRIRKVFEFSWNYTHFKSNIW